MKLFLLNQFSPAAIPVEPTTAKPSFVAKTTTPITEMVPNIPITSSIDSNIFEHHKYNHNLRRVSTHMAGFLGWFRTRKPKWQMDLELYEREICKRSGVSREKLNELTELFMEYRILPRWEEIE